MTKSLAGQARSVQRWLLDQSGRCRQASAAGRQEKGPLTEPLQRLPSHAGVFCLLLCLLLCARQAGVAWGFSFVLVPRGSGTTAVRSRVRSSSNVSTLPPMTRAGSLCGLVGQLRADTYSCWSALQVRRKQLCSRPAPRLSCPAPRSPAQLCDHSQQVPDSVPGASPACLQVLFMVPSLGCWTWGALLCAPCHQPFCPACGLVPRLLSPPRRHAGALQRGASSTLLLFAAGLDLGAAGA